MPSRRSRTIEVNSRPFELSKCSWISGLFQRLDTWKIKWSFHIWYRVNLKFRNLPFSCMKNESYGYTFGCFAFKIRQDVRWPCFWLFALPNRQIYRGTATCAPSNDADVRNL